jgi:hypothetical protein
LYQFVTDSCVQVLFTTSAYGPVPGHFWYELLQHDQLHACTKRRVGVYALYTMNIVFRKGDAVRVRAMPQKVSNSASLFAVHIERQDGIYDTRLMFLNRLLRGDELPKVRRRYFLLTHIS